jgi:hypothetical protein
MVSGPSTQKLANSTNDRARNGYALAERFELPFVF